MAILRKEYELSVWDEILGENGQKEEIKRLIIGANDMDYLGRATNIKLEKTLKGTNNLTFQLPSKYFDSKLGKYVHNEFCDDLFNERKLKLKFNGEWFEFYIKNIQENKNFKSIVYDYTCQDAFIDELSRNGYGITFDTELYNNVEEIGTFTETILEDSIWSYDASKNIGDFTEYSEEKLFKIPISYFGNNFKAYKLNYNLPKQGTITNPFTKVERTLEISDDLARQQKCFWDNGDFDNGIPLLGEKVQVKNDGYIYVPYSQLGFCYCKDLEDANAIEEPYNDTNGLGYAIAPQSIDPTTLIQFIAIPTGAEINIDESGLIVNKNFSYVMTINDWNNNINYKEVKYYDVEQKIMQKSAFSNKVVFYEGYLDSINDIEVNFGKKISITDRTEINISEEIDQYVTVYNNKINNKNNIEGNNLYNMLSNPKEWKGEDFKPIEDYRLCSYKDTRMIIPQLARNLIQNGTEITKDSGWTIMAAVEDSKSTSATISIESKQKPTGLKFKAPNFYSSKNKTPEELAEEKKEEYYTLLNFGIIGQEEYIKKDKIYCLIVEMVKPNDLKNISSIFVGEGGYASNGDYFINNNSKLKFEDIDNDFNQLFKENCLLFKSKEDILNPYFGIVVKPGTDIVIKSVQLFEAYTKGNDFFSPDAKYKYSGRDLFINQEDGWRYCDDESKILAYLQDSKKSIKNMVLFETDIMAGDAYEYNKYFIQQIQYGTEEEIKDTFCLKKYLDDNSSIKYTEDDYKIVTNYLDLNKCPYYDYKTNSMEDCNHSKSSNHQCMYQKYGYCPYLFQTQKHCRKIRTLNGEKSNRFNLTQELSKVFEIYPVYYIEHKENGKIVTDLYYKDDNKKVNGLPESNKETYEKMRKNVFYMTEKGLENKLGFRYEKNLSNISRTLDSNEIVTKLYVEDVDSELSKTGLCSIKTAEDNPSKDSFIIDFSYYILKGLLDKEATEYDLYGKDNNDMGYLKRLGYYNSEYDRYSNLIIKLQDESYTELEANIEVNLTGIETAKQELNKIKKKMEKYKVQFINKNNNNTEIIKSETYNNYMEQKEEQENIYYGLIKDTFANSNDEFLVPSDKNIQTTTSITNFIEWYDESGYKREYIDTKKYYRNDSKDSHGIMEQYCKEYQQIQFWKKERAKILKKINEISLSFYQKYEPYLKEGTWSDDNYLSDNTYYFGAKEVAKQGAIPKATYSITVTDLDVLDDSGDYEFNIADTTYIEDIETFGINQKTGLPNRLKVIISGITYDLDIPSQNTIQIQNYTTQFEDLFSQITASVQSLSFNENIYKRSSNFTATKNVEGDSLQGALNENQLTLVETDEKNIEIDYTGQKGSDINNHNNKYKLNGQGLFFSKNGGQSWDVGVTPDGINADYIKVGSLDASKVQIVDGDYIYFLWDKSGITAYRDPNNLKANNEKEEDHYDYFSDFTRFNKYGLSLVENNKIRLRAGYEYQHDGDDPGNIIQEQELKTNNIGFYLYNNKGQTIFSTETASERAGEDINTATINLIGQMKISNKINTETTEQINYIYSREIQIKNNEINNLILVGEQYLSKIIDILNNYLNSINNISKNHITELFSYINIAYEKRIISRNEYSEGVLNGDIINSGENDEYYILEYTNSYGYTLTISLFTANRKENKSNLFYNVNGKIQNGFSIITNNSSMTISNESENISFNDTIELYYQNTPNNFYIKNGTTEINSISKQNDNSSISSDKNINIQILEYYDLNDIPNGQNTNELEPLYTNYYNVDNKYFLDKVENQITKQSTEGVIGLYLNNRINLDKENSVNEGKKNNLRLLCCGINVKGDKETQVNNIFTIKKDGTLYIGGKILNPDDSSTSGSNQDKTNNKTLSIDNLPDEIIIGDPEIEIDAESGTFRINFGNLVDTKSNLDLKQYVSDEIQAAALQIHSHNINSDFSAKIINQKDSKAFLNWFSSSAITKINEQLSDKSPSSITTVQALRDLLYTMFNVINGSASAPILTQYPYGKQIPLTNTDFTIHLIGTTETAGAGAASIDYYGLLDPIATE